MRAPPPLPLIHKTRPHSASWAAPLGLPAGLPRGRGDGWVGAWWPTVSLVLPSALGVPSPQCLLEVPSSHTPSPASISDLLGSKHLPGPSAVTVLSCLHLLSFLHSQHGLEGEAVIGLPTQESYVPTQRKDFLQVLWDHCSLGGVPTSSRPPPGLPPADPEEGGYLYLASGGFLGAGLTDRGIPATSSPFTKSTDNINRFRISNILVWLKKKKRKRKFLSRPSQIKVLLGWPPGSTRPMVGACPDLVLMGDDRPSHLARGGHWTQLQ